MDAEGLQRLANAQSTKSDKIRALDKAGVRRADIARLLAIRYQHVRNVLEADRQRTRATATNGPAVSTIQLPTQLHNYNPGGRQSSDDIGVFRLTTGADGGLVLPPYVMASFGAGPGEVLVGIAEGQELVLRTAAAAISRAQGLVTSLIPGTDSLADSLVADRVREVADERLDG